MSLKKIDKVDCLIEGLRALFYKGKISETNLMSKKTTASLLSPETGTNSRGTAEEQYICFCTNCQSIGNLFY